MVGTVVERVRVATDVADLGIARRAVRRCFVGVPDSVVGDVQLIVSELMTNAIDHGPEGSVTIELHRDDDVVGASVTSPAPASELRATDTWTVPDADATRGRGLAIVRHLADEVEVRCDDEFLTIVACCRV